MLKFFDFVELDFVIFEVLNFCLFYILYFLVVFLSVKFLFSSFLSVNLNFLFLIYKCVKKIDKK